MNIEDVEEIELAAKRRKENYVSPECLKEKLMIFTEMFSVILKLINVKFHPNVAENHFDNILKNAKKKSKNGPKIAKIQVTCIQKIQKLRVYHKVL